MNITEYNKFLKFCELFGIEPTWAKLTIFINRGKSHGKKSSNA